MTATLTAPEVKHGGTGFDGEGGSPGGGERGDGRGDGASLSFDTARLGLWLLLASVTMLFAAFTSSLLVRRTGEDWVPLRAPALLWLNTALLLASSGTVELGRRALLRGHVETLRTWFGATLGLGCAFVAGQVVAWGELAQQGIFLASNPASSFFYVLTGTHAIHVLGGVVALAVFWFRARRPLYAPGAAIGPRLTATYWHFVDGLWVYLFLVLFVL